MIIAIAKCMDKGNGSYSINNIYLKDGKSIVSRNADWTGSSLHEGNVCSAIAAVKDAKAIKENLGDDELILVSDDMGVVGLENGFAPDSARMELLTDCFVRSGMKITIVPATGKYEKYYLGTKAAPAAANKGREAA